MADILAGKHIVVGITGSIAAFKVAGWVSDMTKREAIVSVVMTRAAAKFISPLTFAALSGQKVYCDMFDLEDTMAHISLGREADLVLIAPASANTISKIVFGMADNLLSTLLLATDAPVIVCPAMNGHMYNHPVSTQNRDLLRQLGYTVISADKGMMACKEEGQGRLPEWDYVSEFVAKELSGKDLKDQKILVTAGPTREKIDPARFLSNRSSGKMGYALARAAFRRGAEVILVSGPVNLDVPAGVTCIQVQSGLEMFETVMAQSRSADIIIKSAAVADFRPAKISSHKVKKHEIDSTLVMEQNPDILFELGKTRKKNQFLVGFAAESRNLEEEGIKKLHKKNLDLIAVNDIRSSDSGFESETNQIMLLWNGGKQLLPLTSKLHTADLLLDKIVELRAGNTLSSE